MFTTVFYFLTSTRKAKCHGGSRL